MYTSDIGRTHLNLMITPANALDTTYSNTLKSNSKTIISLLYKAEIALRKIILFFHEILLENI